MKSPTLLAVALAAALVTPTAFAWSYSGAFEPDTAEDATGGRMFPLPDHDGNPATRKVYFNAFPAQIVPAITTVSAIGIGAAQSRILPPQEMTYRAILGVWKDCNGDGYIGSAETVAYTYAPELLPSQDICPPGSASWEPVSVGAVPEAGFSGIPRYVIREFFVIGPSTNTLASTIKDDVAQVWGDFYRPTDTVHFDCPHYPTPWGTTGSTGGVLMWIDCFTKFSGTHAINNLEPVHGQDSLTFDDPYHPERECDSLLQHDIPVWGNPQREQWCPNGKNTGLVEENAEDDGPTALDCSRATPYRDPTAAPDQRGELSAIVVNDPTGGELSGPKGVPGRATVTIFGTDTKQSRTNLTDARGSYWETPAVDPKVNNPRGSYWKLGDSIEGASCGNAQRTPLFPNFVGERFLGVLEANFSATNPADGKRLVDFPMSKPTGTGVLWASSIGYLAPTYNGGTVRNDLEVHGGVYFTFYARVGANTTAVAQLPPGAAVDGVYADEICRGAQTGIVGQWDCDADNWYNTALGGSAWSSARGPKVAPGVIYQLRDTDCYDGTLVGGVPVYASGAFVADAFDTQAPCNGGTL